MNWISFSTVSRSKCFIYICIYAFFKDGGNEVGSGNPSGAGSNVAEGLEFESRVTTTNTVVHGLTPFTNYR